MTEQDDWLGRQDIPPDTAWRWRLGPLELWALNLPLEWRIAWKAGTDPYLDAVESGPWTEPLPETGKFARFTSRVEEAALDLTAGLADRPVVVRPDTPVWVLGGDRVDFFVSSPLWIVLRMGQSLRPLTEMPSFRPSDTWFGPSTREGELVYSSKTQARIERPPAHLMRAVTRLSVHNTEADPLRVERIKLPVPNLDLYRATDGTWWTAAVSVQRTSGGVAHLKIADGPGEEVEAERVASAREPYREASALNRALSALLG